MLTSTTQPKHLFHYQIQVFTSESCQGNSALVGVFEQSPSIEKMTDFSLNSDVGACVFIQLAGSAVEIRCFSAGNEIQFCGHGTLAAAAALFNRGILSIGAGKGIIVGGKSVKIICHKENYYGFEINKVPIKDWQPSPEMLRQMNLPPTQKCWQAGGVNVLVYDCEETIATLQPNFEFLKSNKIYLGVTAPGKSAAIVSRYFGPASGQNEDAATGSFHAILTGYWSDVLGNDSFDALQLSEQKGFFRCTNHQETVEIAGECRILQR